MKSKLLNTFIILCISTVAFLFAHGNMSKATIGFLQVTKNLSVTAGGLLTVGTDGNGVDVTFYTDVAGEEFLWDASANSLNLDGTNATNVLVVSDGNVAITDDIDVDGTTNLDAVDIDGAFQLDGTLTVGVAGTGLDVQFFSNTSGDHLIWTAADEALTIIGTAGQDALNVDDGNVDIGADVDIDGVLTVDGINASAIAVTDAATYALLLANTGMVHLIPDMSQNSDIDFPVEAAGLYYEFIYIGGAADAHDVTFDTQNNTNFFIGGFGFLDTDAGDAADEVHIGLFSNGSSNSKFTVNNITAGTRLSFYSDGTNWHVNGVVFSDTAPAFADQ